MSFRNLSARRLFAGMLVSTVVFAVAPAVQAGGEYPGENPLEVKFDIKEGAKIGDLVTIVARVTGSEDTGIDRVEFLVDDQPKGTDSSVPYYFDWDTLAEKEG